jgi:hypothetical protein
MNPQRSLRRKIVYLVLMAVLLVPVYWLSRPAVIAGPGGTSDPGGVLAQLRQRHGLAQSSLGEIDPASETMKLATLGMRGIAVSMLWEKANQCKMKKDWDSLTALYEQMAKLQPNFIAVWRHQAWNLSYNCSAEFDDYRDRYRWVMRGIYYLMEGIRYNGRQPILQWDMGFFISHKIGRSDEKKLFRKLFVADDEFHQTRPQSDRDNWLVGAEWFRAAEHLVDQGARLIGQAPIIYRSDASLSLMYYADAVETDGIFGEVAKRAWRNAGIAWQKFGEVEIPSSERLLRLGDFDLYDGQARKLRAEMDSLDKSLRDKLKAEKQARLTSDQREALKVPEAQRTTKQVSAAYEAEAILAVTDAEVTQHFTGPTKQKALDLVAKIAAAAEVAGDIGRMREIVNYDYWGMRARMEQQDDTLSARAAIYEGHQALAEARLTAAKQAFEKGFASWRKVLDAFPSMCDDKRTADDLNEDITDYRKTLKQLDEPFPKDFILADVVKKAAE